MTTSVEPAVWFPAVRSGTGASVFTQRLANGLRQRGLRAEITWLPRRVEYAPWSVAAPEAPRWANVAVINTWLSQRFLPNELPIVAIEHLCVHDPTLAPYKTPAQKLYHPLWIYKHERSTLNRASKIIAVSHYTAERISAAFGIHDIEVIHNSIDVNGPFQPAKKSNPHYPFRLLNAGSWSRRKGTDLLGPIMRTLGNDYELQYTADQQSNRTGDRPSNCAPLGRLTTPEAMADAYRNADALLFPTRMEGLPLVVLEAQACGLPVIATDCSSLPEVVTHGQTGLLCPQDDIQAFAAAARRIAENRSLWSGMRESARSRVEQSFDAPRMIDDYIALFRQVI